ncbi:MAG: metal ABC transporter permease [Phycisphaerales bacterium JB037]
MRTIEYLSDPVLRGIYAPSVVAGVALALVCSTLSVLVVLKRLAFIGQGVSHAAFGGIGVAFLLGVTGVAAAGAGAGAAALQELGLLAIVSVFSIAAALAMARLSRDGRAGASADTAIGIVLVACMAIGFILLQIDQQRVSAAAGRGEAVSARPAIDAVLFGSLGGIGWIDAAIAWGAAAGALGVLWWVRRPMLLWSFDERGAGVFGVAGGRMRTILMVLLAVAVVVTMRLAGVILATAMLVLPGAIALRVSGRLWGVVALSGLAALVGVLGGLVVSFEFDLQPGPSVVGVLIGIYALARAAGSAGLVGGAIVRGGARG